MTPDTEVKPIGDEDLAGALVGARMGVSSPYWDQFDKKLAANFLKLHARLTATEEANSRLRLAIIALAPEIENEIEQREECGDPDSEYVQRLVRPWHACCDALTASNKGDSRF